MRGHSDFGQTSLKRRVPANPSVQCTVHMHKYTCYVVGNGASSHVKRIFSHVVVPQCVSTYEVFTASGWPGAGSARLTSAGDVEAERLGCPPPIRLADDAFSLHHVGICQLLALSLVLTCFSPFKAACSSTVGRSGTRPHCTGGQDNQPPVPLGHLVLRN